MLYCVGSCSKTLLEIVIFKFFKLSFPSFTQSLHVKQVYMAGDMYKTVFYIKIRMPVMCIFPYSYVTDAFFSASLNGVTTTFG